MAVGWDRQPERQENIRHDVEHVVPPVRGAAGAMRQWPVRTFVGVLCPPAASRTLLGLGTGRAPTLLCALVAALAVIGLAGCGPTPPPGTRPSAPAPPAASPSPASRAAAIPVHVRFGGSRLNCVDNFPYSCTATLSLVRAGTAVPDEWRPSAADASWVPGDPRPLGAEPVAAPGPLRLVVSLLGSYDVPSYAPDGSRAFDLLSRCWADVDVPAAGALDVLIAFSNPDPDSFRVSCSVVVRAT